jgi:hypothetical protein
VSRHDADGKIRVVVVRTLGFLIVSRLAGLFGLGPSPDARDVEIAVLRHQLAVLGRQVARPRYAPGDRMLLAVLARLLPRDRWRVFLVTPSTLLRWHRELVARRWTYPATGRSRRGLPGATVELVVRLARENPRWGYVRIVGEARKLGVAAAACGSVIVLVWGPLHGGVIRVGWISFARRLAGRWRRTFSLSRRSV